MQPAALFATDSRRPAWPATPGLGPGTASARFRQLFGLDLHFCDLASVACPSADLRACRWSARVQGDPGRTGATAGRENFLRLRCGGVRVLGSLRQFGSLRGKSGVLLRMPSPKGCQLRMPSLAALEYVI